MTSCPRCGEPAERGQLVCVECGTRIALKEEGGDRRSFDNVPAVVLLLCVVVIGAGALGFAIGELTGGSGNEAAADRTDQSSPAAKEGAAQTETDTGASQAPSQSLLMEWPRNVTGYTVVIVTTGDRPAARRVATEAAQSGLEAGVLDSNKYDLGTDLWIVFAGRFDNQASAESQAANLGERYPGAYATQVKPAG
ncbi:MAG: zinc-ribbon domain [Thermoleophilaceae bacterium]|nr:zinc-ribbon domain [Thermoleophilaceae bacterium]